MIAVEEAVVGLYVSGVRVVIAIVGVRKVWVSRVVMGRSEVLWQEEIWSVFG